MGPSRHPDPDRSAPYRVIWRQTRGTAHFDRRYAGEERSLGPIFRMINNYDGCGYTSRAASRHRYQLGVRVPSRNMATAFVARDSRVALCFASPTQWAYSRRWLNDSRSYAACAALSDASAVASSAGTTTSRGPSSSSITIVTASPAVSPIDANCVLRKPIQPTPP